MCDLARPEPAPLPVKLRPPSPVRRVPALPIKPKEPTPEDLDSWRQRLMKEEGLKLIQLIKASHIPHLSLSCNHLDYLKAYFCFKSTQSWTGNKLGLAVFIWTSLVLTGSHQMI